jgi:hypothetical protein
MASQMQFPGVCENHSVLILIFLRVNINAVGHNVANSVEIAKNVLMLTYCDWTRNTCAAKEVKAGSEM